MQRVQSAVDFSSLLNSSNSSKPDITLTRDNDDRPGQLHELLMQGHRGPDGESAPPSIMQPSVGGHGMVMSMIRPNGPLPSSTPAEHSAELPRPYKCPLCDKAFHRLEHQTRHIRTHTGEKPHACHFPGCAKRFSRSDELTRHSRIHANPHRTRNGRPVVSATPPASHMQAGAASDRERHANGTSADNMMMPPPAPKASRSAPTSTLGSPNVSPPHSFSTSALSTQSPYLQRVSAKPGNHNMDISLLARAANRVESESLMAPPPPHFARPQGPPSQQPLPPSSMHGSRPGPYLPSLSPYHMSRSHSQDDHHQHHAQQQQQPHHPPPHYHHHASVHPHPHSHHYHPHGTIDDHYGPHAYRHAKRSRPNSPNSTAPSSPTFSHDSLSPTPDHTPLATPAHSPRLRPIGLYPGYELPGLRNLTLHPNQPQPQPQQQHQQQQQQPQGPPAPMEPQVDTPISSYAASQAAQQASAPPQRTGLSLSDIMSRPDASQRKLPLPSFAVAGGGPVTRVQDLLLGPSPATGYGSGGSDSGYGGTASGRTSASGSISGGDLMERA